MKKIYLDNAATTPVDGKVLSAMKQYWANDFANPSSIHSMGVKAKIALQDARKTVAHFLSAHDREIIFTSGGTESNNLAIFGLINAIRKEGRKYSDIHVITTEIEHSSVYECFDELQLRGTKIDYLKVDQFGLVDPKELRGLITPNTLLISIGYVNTEIGVIQPIKEIIKEIRHKRKEMGKDRVSAPYLHLDASGALQYLNMNVEELGVDLMTIDAQKIYGPKGIGALYIRDGVNIDSMFFGGGQEKGLRSGTENIPLIVGFAKALEILGNMKKEGVRVAKLRDEFFHKIKKNITNVIINGDIKNRLPNNINISIPGQDGEMMVLRLDEMGIICSSASACASGEGESKVVRKIAEKSGLSKKEVDIRAQSTIRLSLGRDTKTADMKYLLKSLVSVCK